MQTLRLFLKKRIITDTAWYSVAHACVQICNVIGVFLVARYLGPTNIGLYSFAQNYLALFVTILSGIDTYVHWRMVREPHVYEYVVSCMKYKAYIVVPLIVLFWIISYIILPPDIFRFIPILSIPIFTSIFASVIFLFQHQNYSRFVAIWMSISAIVILLLKIIAVYTGQSLITFVAINSIDGIILVLASMVLFVFQKNKTSGVSVDFSFTSMLKKSLFPILYICAWYIVIRLDQFIVPLHYNAYTLGLYAAAVKITEITNVLLVILQSLLLPRIKIVIESFENQKKALVIYTGVGILSALFLSLFAPYIISFFYGNDFMEAVEILQVYAWSIPGLFVTYFYSSLYLAKQQYKKIAMLTLAISIGVIPASFFAATFGVATLAFVSVLAYTVTAVIYYKYL